MRQDIIEYLQKEIKRKCELPSNFFGMGCFYHIIAVVDNAVILAKQFGADEEVVIIAAWLHDVASITDYNLYEEHHIHGAKMAKEILEKFDYDKEKTAQVQSCVLNHRGSISGERLSLEEMCVADADAISHFDNVPSLLYLAYIFFYKVFLFASVAHNMQHSYQIPKYFHVSSKAYILLLTENHI